MDFRADILPHRDRLYRLALGITLHAAEAEDVVQDTFLRAWEHRAEWPAIQDIAAWLAHVCRNLALDRRKKDSRTIAHDRSESTVPPSSTSSAPGTEHPWAAPDAFEAREALALLSRLIARLPPPQADIIRLRDIEGLPYRDIARQLHLTEAQVRVYLHRARQKLRQQYDRIQNYGL